MSSYIGTGRQYKAQPLGIYEEECFVFPDRPAERSCPLIGIVEWLGRATLVVEVAICVETASIPPIECIPVKAVGARLGHVVYVGSRQCPVLTRIAIGHDGCLADIVVAE